MLHQGKGRFAPVLIAFLLGSSACGVLAQSKPIVVIASPPSGSEFHAGDTVVVQSFSTDAAPEILRVEFLVDNVVVQSAPDPTGKGVSSFPYTFSWQAIEGSHILLVQAHSSDQASDPAGISVTVLAAATPTPAPPTATLLPPSASSTPTASACTDNAVFVKDVTIPDGTVLAPGQTFVKTWRVRNTGCPWGAGYQLVFVSGQAMTATRTLPLPETAGGATADLSVSLAAPSAPGAYSGTWRLRNAAGTQFGTIVTVNISVPGAASPTKTSAPVACSGVPNISSFTATQTIITAGGSSTLNWGPVTNADSVDIDPTVGGIGTPGSVTVTPTTTTTYTLTAHCGSETATAQVRILIPFAIIGTQTSADQTDVSGVCPKTINFSAIVTVNDAGSVNLKWETSDGSFDSAPFTLTFSAAGSQTVARSWTLGSSGKTLTDYWMRIHTSSPNDVTSNNATFTVRCN